METELSNIKDLSVADRPREKLIKFGPAGLSNAELIAIILRAGTRSSPLAQICNTLIEYISDNLFTLATIQLEHLAQIKGVGEVKAITLLAAIELGKRSIRPAAPLNLHEDKFVEDFIRPYFNADNVVQYHLVMLNNRSELLATSEMATGPSPFPDIKSILKLSLEAGAFEIVLCRNKFRLFKRIADEEKAYTIQLDAAFSMLRIKMRGLMVINQLKI
jgi:DNA repair protein RadC